jgi:2-polyprenyl-3-methyl-5-hydroxy-6-metoxy-1,4-benzoquinol methylase
MITKCDVCGHNSPKKIWVKNDYQLMRCGGCGLIYVANPPTSEQLEKLYSFDSGYHKVLVKNETEIARHVGEAQSNLSTLSKCSKPAKVLDVGCSTGLFLIEAQSAGWAVTGLEYSADSARVAREQNHLNVKQGALQLGMFPPASFDVVTMWDVIEHLPSPNAALEVVLDVLKPGGIFVAKTPNANGLYPVASLAVANTVGFWGHAEPPGHLYQFSEKTLSDLFVRKGFTVKHVFHGRIPIAYSFGTVREWFRSLKWLAYTIAFAPLAALGPYLGRGDDMTIVAIKKEA